jgi:hypothetical protein
MRHFGHASHMRTERPDSVAVPSEEKLTVFQRVILGITIVGGLLLGVSVGHGYYVWFLK